MITEKLEPVWNWVKASLWKVACGILAFLCLIMLLSYFLQGGELAENALSNAQRLVIPLKGEGEWIGTQVKLDIKTKPETDEVPIAPISSEESIDAHGQAADLTGTVPESIADEAAADAHSETEVVVSEALEEEYQEEEAEAAAESIEEAPLQAAEGARKPIPKRPHDKPLAAAPAEELTEKIGEYRIPRISEDGVKPWEYYRKSFDKTGPIIAVVIHGLGLGRLTTENALNLDSHVTLSFSPYAKNAEMWGSHARNIGHEIMLDLPQEGKDYPATDPGPYALINALDAEGNKERLHWVMSRAPGYVGFLQAEEPAIPGESILAGYADIANRGLFVLETPGEKPENLKKHQEQMGLITHPYTRRLDEVLSEEDIQKQLDLLVKDAKLKGTAIAVARPYPLTLELLDKWSQELESMNVTLAPVSAVIKRDF